jgi:hypothetical protein
VSAGDWRERCLQAEQENARLAADLKLYKDRLAAEAAEMRVSELEGAVGVLQSQRHYEQDRAEQAEQQRDAAHAALMKYGRHNSSCAIHYQNGWPCNCGLDAALPPAPAQETERGR